MAVTTDQSLIDFNRAMASIAAFVAAPRPALNEFANYAKDQHKKALQGRYDPKTGKPWKPLAASTIAQKAAKGKGRGGLTIVNSLYTDTTDTSVTIGYLSPIAPIQHYGAKIPARTIIPKNRQALYWVGARHPVGKVNQPAYSIPARPLIGFSQNDINRLEDLMFRSIVAIWENR